MSARRRGPARHAESGAAVVEFVLVAVPLLLLFLAVVQLGLALHVRNTLAAAAAEGARYGATADREPQQGAARAMAVVSEALGPGLSARTRASAGLAQDAGAPTVVVELVAPLPLVGLLGPGGLLRVRAAAWDEP